MVQHELKHAGVSKLQVPWTIYALTVYTS